MTSFDGIGHWTTSPADIPLMLIAAVVLFAAPCAYAQQDWEVETKPSEKTATPEAPTNSTAGMPKPPPLKKGEKVYKIRNGCGMIGTPVATADGDAMAANAFADRDQVGKCVQGLMMHLGSGGPGTKSSKGSFSVWWGRVFGYDSRNVDGRTFNYYALEGPIVHFSSLDTRNIDWENSFAMSDGKTSVAPSAMTDYSPELGQHKIYGVVVDGTTIPCPNPTSPQGCEALYKKHAEPVIKNIKKFIASSKPEFERRRREIAVTLDPSILVREAEQAKAAASKKAMEAAAAAEAQKAADAQAAADAAKQQELAALRAEADKAAGVARANADAEFTTSLDGLDAGKLFVLADKLKRDGQIERARTAFQTIVEKHANHAMAAPAAQALTTLDATAKPAADGSAPSACTRNGKKLDAFVTNLKKTNAAIPASDGPLVSIRTHEARMKVYAPCTEQDAAARAEFERSLNLKKKAEEKCAAAGAEACKGALSGPAQSWVDAVMSEVQRALSDPLYSADLGAGTVQN